jgi:threonine/homoserine/homoserine lactone efflux protein
VATADGIYGALAVLGLSFVSEILINAELPLRIIGGLFLLYLGVSTFRAKPAETAAKPKTDAKGLTGAYASMLALTLTNPMTILAFAAIFAAISGEDPACLPWVAVGVPLGSVLWWALLAWVVGLVRDRITPRTMLWINRASGALIVFFGLSALIGLLMG